jgi:hypothetical protein
VHACPAAPAALFLDSGGTLALARDHRTGVDADGRPVLMPNVPARLAATRATFDAW